MRAKLSVLFLLPILGACARAALPPSPAVAALGGVQQHGFDGDAPGAEPAGFLCAAPGPAGSKPARWQVVAVPDAPSGRQVLEQSDDDPVNHRYPVALSATAPADVRVAVTARALRGTRDRSFGVVLRAQDPGTYYVARANTSPWGSNIRLYRMDGGRRRQLDEWSGPVAPERWYRLEFEAVGTRLTVRLDGQAVIAAEDDAIRAPGRCGVWTKSEAVSQFDDLSITPLAMASATGGEPLAPAPR